MVRVDITCDLMDEYETGHVWAFLRNVSDQALSSQAPSSSPVTRMRQPSPKSSISSTSQPDGPPPHLARS